MQNTTYTALYKSECLVFGTNPHIAIITGWTPLDRATKRIQSNYYAVMGNLYSPSMGIDYLVRNLLHNPQITTLILVSATRQDKNSGSVQCLIDFFSNGVVAAKDSMGRVCWKIDSEVEGYIGFDIHPDDLQELRDSIDCRYTTDVDGAGDIAEAFTLYRNLGANVRPVPKTYLKPESLSVSFPCDRVGFRISGTLPEVWVKALKLVTDNGKVHPTRFGTSAIEILDLMAVITNDGDSFPDYLPVSQEQVDRYIPEMLTPAPSDAKYNYASRLRTHFGYDQLEQIANELAFKPDSRGCVASLWDVQDYFTGEPPCLTNLWLRIVEGKLIMTAVFRSHDIYNAWLSNAYGLRAVQQHILSRITSLKPQNITVGELVIISQSAHIYSDTLEYARSVVTQTYNQIVSKELHLYKDDVGNFLVETKGTSLLVTRLDIQGVVIKSYEGENPLLLGREITADVPFISPDHALYLGMELEKAYASIALGRAYTQDTF